MDPRNYNMGNDSRVSVSCAPPPPPTPSDTSLVELTKHIHNNAEQAWMLAGRLEHLLRRLQGSAEEATGEGIPKGDGLLGEIDVGLVCTSQGLAAASGFMFAIERHI